jgi:hypothetical protein
LVPVELVLLIRVDQIHNLVALIQLGAAAKVHPEVLVVVGDIFSKREAGRGQRGKDLLVERRLTTMAHIQPAEGAVLVE